MKKIILFIFLSTFSFSWELNIKSGANLYKEKELVLSTEVMAYSRGIFEAGLGIETNLSKNNLTSIYALTHINMYRSNKVDSSIYFLGKLGGAIHNKKPAFYGSFGLGIDFDYLLTEIIYEGSILNNDKNINKFGIRFGFKIGDETLHFKPYVSPQNVKIKGDK